MKSKRKRKLQIDKYILACAYLVCEQNDLFYTDYNFSDNLEINFDMFQYHFTMQDDTREVVLAAALTGYNDNLN